MNDTLERIDNDKINDGKGRNSRKERKKNCENARNRRKLNGSVNKKEEPERKEIDESDSDHNDHENENDEETEKNDILYEEIPEEETGKDTKSNNIYKKIFCKATMGKLMGKR